MTLLELRPYQLAGAQWLVPRRHALLADDMGLGKSCQAIHAADLIGAKDILVICPANARVNWEREFERFSPMDRPCSVIFGMKDIVPPSGVVITSFEWASTNAQKLKAKTWDLLILDEAHYLKEKTAARTKAVYGRSAKFPGIAGKAARTWRLTGTPTPNKKASELWTHLYSCGIVTDSYWDFVFHFCTGFDAGFGFQIRGHKNEAELEALLKPFMLRRLKEDVLTDLPPIRFEEVTVERSAVELDPDFLEQMQGKGPAGLISELQIQEKILYETLMSIKGNDCHEARLQAIEGMGRACSTTTLRRWIGMAKLPSVLEVIDAELASGSIDKIVIFAVHQSIIEAARKKLDKYHAVTLYGKTPLHKRQMNIDRFMNDPACRVFVGNVQAAGIAITLTSACEVAFVEKSWVPSDNAQAAMRVHRFGQTRPVRIRSFALYKSVDEQVDAVLTRKMKELCRIL
jgi:SWI/SNF-related matrix-associated actin-dependent regulator 1 of chromatin subfamily A